ncbi:heparinase II/III domain-containing protein, partial [Campylobacter sp. RM19072]|uniref:heparinase II/III domain-containing protein n=1 Tax=Campylobacter sp. RM19072 TaxID=2735785 RepID=UPI002A4F5165|nr:heparinase II/III family protein [Campylobacter sp. RM19072]
KKGHKLITNSSIKSAEDIINNSIYKAGNGYIIDLSRLNLDGHIYDYDYNTVDRTYMWHLHQMKYIYDLMQYDKLYNNNIAINYIKNIVKIWWSKFKDNLSDIFAWHDHATAIRTEYLSDLYIYLLHKNHDKEFLLILRDILEYHMNILYNEKFYSKFTNHGLDQSLSLYKVSSFLIKNNNTDILRKIKKTAIDRINSEISYAFCVDGGHKENSPAYLNFGLSQVIKALKLGKEIDGDNSGISFSHSILQKAITNLAFIVQPNGKLPLIGDTKEFIVKDMFGDLFLYENSYQNFLYSIRQGEYGIKPDSNDLILPESGWAIFRETWDKLKFKKSMQIVFKCGYLSNYHRHDDDLNITLFYDDEEWLSDCGEYKHAPKDPYRIYFRSSDAHNISKPYNIKACRDLDELKIYGRSLINDYKCRDNVKSSIEGESHIFRNFKNTRKVSYDRKFNNIVIEDNCYPIAKVSQKLIKERIDKNYFTYITRFHIPSDKQIVIKDDLVEVIGKNKKLTISAINFSNNSGGGRIMVSKGKDNSKIIGWRSCKAGVLEAINTLEFYYKIQTLNQKFELTFHDIQQDRDNMEINVKIIDGMLNASLEPINKNEKNKFAFYLLYNKEKIEQKWYSYDNKVTFETKIDKTLAKYHVIGYVRDKNGNSILRKAIRLSDNHVSIVSSLKNNSGGGVCNA